MKKHFQLISIVILSAGLVTGCKKDKGDPPLLPPFASMVIDFSNFTSQKKSAESVTGIKGTESSTWEFAAGVAGVWNTLISSSITVPLAAYSAAAGNNPAYVSDKLWQWSYSFSSGQDSYSAKLQGNITTNSVTWKLMITKEGTGGYNDFAWIEGTSQTDGSGGQWNFKESPQSDIALFQTDWTKSGDQVISVKYTYEKNDDSKNSYINFLTQTTSNFDLSYNIHFSNGLYSDADIEWNIATRDGRLKCLDYLQDENWYCWDTNKINKLCD